MNSPRGKHTYREILSQGQTWAATLKAVETLPDGLASWLSKLRQGVVFTGCGSTYYLSLAAAAIWQSLTGLSARGAPASDVWLFPESVLPPEPSLLVAVSRSAETTETLRAIEVYRQRSGKDPLVVTCYGDREMARMTPHVLVTRQAEEESVAQTRSFSSMFVMSQAAAGLVAGNPAFVTSLSALPEKFERLVKMYEPLARQLAEDQRLQQFTFLGSGANYGLACEAMLKMKEMSLSPSEAFHFLEFRHGPKSVVTERTLVVGLLSEPAREQELKVLSEMRALDASVLALDESAAGHEAEYQVELDSGLEPLARGALFLPVLQLLAYYRSISKGLDPDRPNNLDAVVKL